MKMFTTMTKTITFISLTPHAVSKRYVQLKRDKKLDVSILGYYKPLKMSNLLINTSF